MTSSIFKNFFNDTITTVYSVTKDGYGDISQTTVYSNVPCKLDYNSAQKYTDKRKSLQSTHDIEVKLICYISSEYTIGNDYEFLINGVYYKISKLFKQSDVFGKFDHYLLHLV